MITPTNLTQTNTTRRATSPSPIVVIEQIGPDIAARYLAMNTHNRHLRPSIVDRLARAMANDEWMMNGETIKFSETTLLDGQHRLAAVVKSGRTVPFMVVRGLQDILQETVDIGEKRSLADILTLRGEKNGNVLAGAIRTSALLTLNGHVFSGLGYVYPTIQEMLAFLDEHPGLRDSVPMGDRANGAEIRFPNSIAAGLHFLMLSIDTDDGEDFWDRLVTGAGLNTGDAILTLRQYLIRDLGAQRRMDTVRRIAITIKTWNNYREGRPMAQVRWTRGGKTPEDFPVMK